jgi:V8-like Glu-specific endopeptidase
MNGSDRRGDVKARARELLPDLGELHERLRETPADVLAEPLEQTAPAETEAVSRGGGRRTHRAQPRAVQPPRWVRQERERIVEDGKRAIAKLSRQPDADLTHDEERGLEAIVVLVGRPALLVQGGTFADPPDTWSILIRPDVRPRIEANLQSVGRIEVTGHPSGMDWLGTGFLVADDVVMTNRHVAVEFARTRDGASWEFYPGMKARIDYVEELDATTKAEFKVSEVIGIHDSVDLALLRVARRGSPGARKPKPLALAAKPKLAKERKVYVVGYPASDSRRNDPIEMRRIFESIFDVKRLQPGQLTGLSSGGKIVGHDCSTLGGNSGSCVIDLDTHQVVALHFSGKYLIGNSAVVLSKLRDDQLLKKAGLAFG